MMAEQELKATLKDAKDDNATTPKPACNNPSEAARYMKEVDRLTDKFIEKIRGFDRYKQEQAYHYFVHDIWRQLKSLNNDYFKHASIDTH